MTKKFPCILYALFALFTSCEPGATSTSSPPSSAPAPQATVLGTYEGVIDPAETRSLGAQGLRSLPPLKRLGLVLAIGTKNLIAQYRLVRKANNTVHGALWFGNKTSGTFEKGFDLVGALQTTGTKTTITLSAQIRGRKIKKTLRLEKNGRVLVDSAGNTYKKK